MRPAIRNVAFNLAGQLLPMAVALVAMPLLLHHAGSERLGFLGLAWALIGYFGLLDLGLSRVVTRRIALGDEARALDGEVGILRRLAVGLFTLVAIISALLALLLPASAIIGKGAPPDVADEARTALLILWATLPLTVVTGLMRGALEGLQQFGRVNVLRASFGAWSFAAPLVILPWTHALGPLTLSIAIGRTLSLLAHAYWAFEALRGRHLAHRSSDGPIERTTVVPGSLRVRDLLTEGGWLTVSNVVGPLMVNLDRFAIAAIVSLAAASYYFVPQEVSLRMLVIPSAVATTIFPMLARAGAGAGNHRTIAQGALLAVGASCLPLCAAMAVFAEPLLSLWMGPGFAHESASVATCLAIGLFANCCAQVPFAWIQAAGRADITGKLHLAQLPVYAVLLVLLTMKFGIVGAAIAWSVRAVGDAVLLFIASATLFPRVALKTTLRPIVAGLALLTLLSLGSAIGDPVLKWTLSSVILVGCLAISVTLAARLPRDIRR